ncbi:metal ABC transporter solute-binding protein, Zn/Mn family [Salinispira pacifica]
MASSWIRISSAALLPVLLFIACGASPRGNAVAGGDSATAASGQDRSGSPLRVMAGVVPAGYLARQIGGSAVDVSVMVPPGREPHTYEPTPQQVTELSKAKIYVRVGMPFEESLLPRIRATAPGLTVVDLRTGVELRPISGGRRVLFKPGDPADENLDPHIWLGPRELATEAATLRDAFIAARPGERELIESNYRSFTERLSTLDARLARMLKPLDGKSILVFHPAFGYFTDTYGITQLAIEKDGREPGPRELLDVIRTARSAGVRSVFVEPEFAETTARRIAESLGVDVVVINPLAADVLANLLSMAKAFLAGTVGVS